MNKKASLRHTAKCDVAALEASARAHRNQADWFRRLKLNASAELEDKLASEAEAKAKRSKKYGNP